MSVYAMLVVDVKDPAAYALYASEAAKISARYEVEVLAAGATPNAVEGAAPTGKVVLIRFKDQDTFDHWYQSPEYQAVLPLRLESADTPLFLAFDGLN